MLVRAHVQNFSGARQNDIKEKTNNYENKQKKKKKKISTNEKIEKYLGLNINKKDIKHNRNKLRKVLLYKDK